MEVEVKFQSPVQWIRSLVQTHSARIKIRDIRKSQGGTKDLFEIFAPDGAISAVSLELQKQAKTQDGYVTLVDDHHATAIISAEGCAICNSMHNWDLFLTGAYADNSGDVIMRWLVPDETTVSGFLSRLETDGVKFQLLKKKVLNRRGDITSRQEYVVKTALDLGFFDYPKKVNLEGLSRRLNVSYVTLAEILRRAEKNIFSSYFEKKEG